MKILVTIRHRAGAGVAAAVTILLLAAMAAQGASPGASEAEVKAAMLYNFLKFVEWPPAAGPSFVIGVHGSGGFASLLARTVADRSVDGRPVVVRQANSPAEMQGCSVLFVARADPAREAAAVEAVRRSPVLTVGDGPDFTRRGGMIGFVLVDNRTNFEINREVSSRAGLKISSKLLRLAAAVRETP